MRLVNKKSRDPEISELLQGYSLKATVGDDDSVKLILPDGFDNTIPLLRREYLRLHTQQVRARIHLQENRFPLSNDVIRHHIHILLGQPHPS